MLERLQKDGYVRYEDLPLETKDGRKIAVEFVSNVYEVGDKKVIQCDIRDITKRKEAEVTANLLAAIVQSSDDAIVGKNLDGIVTSWNAGAEKIFGYTAQEMAGQPVMKLIPLDRQHEEEEILSKIRRGESIHHFDTIRQRKDGGKLEVSVTISPIKDSTGKIIGVSKVARDITERIQTARALQQREAEFRTLTEAMPQIVWATDAAGGNIYFNQRWTDYTGFTQEESRGDGWTKPFHPEDQPRAWAAWQKAVAGHGDYSLECRLRRADGVYRWWWILGAPLRAADGSIIKWFGTCTDITERKQAEAALRDSEERFRTMANSMSQLAWITRADGFIIWYNKRWYEYTGTTPEQMEGWGWQSVHDPVMLPKVMAKWQAAIDSGQPFDMEFPIRGADGRFRNFLSRGQPLKDSTGRVVQWFGTNTDVDELKRAEEKIRLLNAQLEQRVAERTAQLEAANQELEAFSYSVSHDLRAPLRAVNGFAGMVLAEFGAQLPAAGKHYLERIQKGGLRMGVLIDDLLAFSRLNRQAVKWQRVDTDQLVELAWEELKTQREGRAIEFKVADLSPCQGDGALLKQVWINLLSNAIKYTQGRTPAMIEIGCTRDAGEAVYFVRDNGAGFDMQYANKLFGVFQRLHRADEFEGTGVGLAIVQRIIHRHGGRVRAEAEVNRGATFFFTLGQTKPT
jgi:PAS domain S-box-containing protein